ncbi:MAG: NADH-quinone oxidoreductase subunit M [Gemmataceae bacterium]|nr:NADH-quinone oxidoreductase subunit M [Gemmataceae bacterium]
MIPTFRILVLLLVAVPLLSAAVVPLFGRAARRAALVLALLQAGLTAAVVLVALPVLNQRGESMMPDTPGRARPIQRFVPEFVPGDPGYRGNPDSSTHRTGWTLLSFGDGPADRPGPRVQFYVGVDGLNVWLVALCSLMMLAAILVSWEAVADRPGPFYGWLFVLQAGAVGAFLSFDLILFYAFFELTLIPSFFLIGRWGNGPGRRDAARKFFLYTLGGSLLTLVGLVGVVLTNPLPDGRVTFALPDLMAAVQQRTGGPGSAGLQAGLFACLVAGFLVKVPVWPLHTWMPAAYREAPIGVTILLSALLAKLGTFGLLRIVLPLMADAAVEYGLYGRAVIGVLAGVGIVYGALCAYAQRDIKMMVAYGSLSHLGFLVLGLLAFNTEGVGGAALHMVNHGVSTGALFALLAFLLDRYRTTDMRAFGGLMGRFPRFAVLAFVVCLASIGLPGLNNFVSEMLMMAGLFDPRAGGGRVPGFAVVAAAGIFLSAWYVLTMLRRVFFGPPAEPPAVAGGPVPDIDGREGVALGGLAAVCLLLGLFPQVVLDPMEADVAVVAAIGDAARDRVEGPAPKGYVPPAPRRFRAPDPPPAGGGGGLPPPPFPEPAD